jgi:hypothetical protein
MAKKLTFLLAAIAVLAFAVPAMASAAVPTLQEESGTPVKTGTTIRGTGSNVILTSSTLGEIKCTTITLEGVLSVNDMTNGITASNTGQVSPPTTDCTNGTNTVNVTNVTLTDLKSTVGGVAKTSFTAVVDIGASTTCTFTGKEVEGTYANGGSVLTFTAATGITSSPVACGTAKLDGKFTLELTTGKAVKAVF